MKTDDIVRRLNEAFERYKKEKQKDHMRGDHIYQEGEEERIRNDFKTAQIIELVNAPYSDHRMSGMKPAITTDGFNPWDCTEQSHRLMGMHLRELSMMLSNHLQGYK